jgi:hypothetical protein
MNRDGGQPQAPVPPHGAGAGAAGGTGPQVPGARDFEQAEAQLRGQIGLVRVRAPNDPAVPRMLTALAMLQFRQNKHAAAVVSAEEGPQRPCAWMPAYAHAYVCVRARVGGADERWRERQRWRCFKPSLGLMIPW